jgi:hypothetical protein
LGRTILIEGSKFVLVMNGWAVPLTGAGVVVGEAFTAGERVLLGGEAVTQADVTSDWLLAYPGLLRV